MTDFVVYRIRNQSNGHVYVGSTQDFKKRTNRHLYFLRKGRHHSVLMQIDWTEQKGRNFVIKVVGRYKTRHEAYTREFALIQNQLNEGKCYNILVGGQGGDALTFHPNRAELSKMRAEYLAHWRKSLTPDELEKMSFSRRGSKNPNWRGGRKHCKCGTPIEERNTSCMKCSDKTGLNNPFFGRSHSPETIAKLKSMNVGRLPPNTKRARINGVEYVSATEASRQLGLHVTVISYRIRSKNPMFSEYQYVQEV